MVSCLFTKQQPISCLFTVCRSDKLRSKLAFFVQTAIAQKVLTLKIAICLQMSRALKNLLSTRVSCLFAKLTRMSTDYWKLTFLISGVISHGLSVPLQVPGQPPDLTSNYWPRLQWRREEISGEKKAEKCTSRSSKVPIVVSNLADEQLRLQL